MGRINKSIEPVNTKLLLNEADELCVASIVKIINDGSFPVWKSLFLVDNYWEVKSMIFNVTIERDEDGAWVTECPAIPGCVSQGKTRQQALGNIKEAIALCLEVRAEKGLPLTVETQQIEVAV